MIPKIDTSLSSRRSFAGRTFGESGVEEFPGRSSFEGLEKIPVVSQAIAKRSTYSNHMAPVRQAGMVARYEIAENPCRRLARWPICLAISIPGPERPDDGMIDPPRAAFRRFVRLETGSFAKIILEIILILAEVMPEPGEFGPIAVSEDIRKFLS
ncbi:MAG TPA: hypothetical protein VMV83_03125 [Rectinemataceae bacterium]|nr:hypothetical protein [Rectinemataceae bacterium]